MSRKKYLGEVKSLITPKEKRVYKTSETENDINEYNKFINTYLKKHERPIDYRNLNTTLPNGYRFIDHGLVADKYNIIYAPQGYKDVTGHFNLYENQNIQGQYGDTPVTFYRVNIKRNPKVIEDDINRPQFNYGGNIDENKIFYNPEQSNLQGIEVIAPGPQQARNWLINNGKNIDDVNRLNNRDAVRLYDSLNSHYANGDKFNNIVSPILLGGVTGTLSRVAPKAINVGNKLINGYNRITAVNDGVNSIKEGNTQQGVKNFITAILPKSKKARI